MLKSLFGGGGPDHPLADPREAKRILEELPPLDAYKALEELGHWHESVLGAPGFKPEQRAQIAVQIDDAAQARVRKLSREYFAAARPSRFQEARMWTHVSDYWRQAGAAFVASSEALAGAGGKHAELLASVLHRAARSLAQHLKWMHLRYGPVDLQTWGRLNRICLMAEERKADAARKEYVKAALFSASSPDSLLPREVDLAEKLIGDLAEGFVMAGAASPELPYWVDLSSAMAPVRAAKAPPPGATLRCFGGGGALTALQQMIQQIESTGRVPADAGLAEDYDAGAALDLMQHLAMYWSPVPPERRHPRHSVKSRVAIVQGFDSLLQVLGPEDPLTFTRPVEEAWVVENVSAGGFGALVPHIQGDWLRVGALLAIQPEGGKNWLVGVVRRVSRVSGQQARVGIQTLSRAPAMAELSLREGGHVPGLILPPLEAGASGASLVLRPDVFVAGATLEAEQGGRQHVYHLQEVTERGADYEIVRSRLLIRES